MTSHLCTAPPPSSFLPSLLLPYSSPSIPPSLLLIFTPCFLVSSSPSHLFPFLSILLSPSSLLLSFPPFLSHLPTLPTSPLFSSTSFSHFLCPYSLSSISLIFLSFHFFSPSHIPSLPPLLPLLCRCECSSREVSSPRPQRIHQSGDGRCCS